jgi:general L-amino acid transport system substrate-binding protein
VAALPRISLGKLAVMALIGLAIAHDAFAGGVLDRVRRSKVVRCSAEERPDVASPRPDGGIDGIAVSLCRAVAVAVLGRDGRISFAIDAPVQSADLAFVAAPGVAGTEPAVFVDRLSVLVPIPSRVRDLRDLDGETVCLMIGSPEQSALEATVGRLGIDIVRLAFEEDDEMRDAYAVGRCGAMVGFGTELAEWRKPFGINRLASRLLPEPMALVPIVATTGTTDRDWREIVSWIVRVVVTGAADNPRPAGVRADWDEKAGVIAGRRVPTSERAASGNSGTSSSDDK